MTIVPLHIDGTERTSRTQIFTSSTPDASLFIHDRNFGRIGSIRIQRHHFDCSYRTMARTVSTRHSIGHRQTVRLHPYRMANLNRRFIGRCDRQDCPCRTDLRTFRTLRTTIAPFIRHFGLHQSRRVCRWTQHPIRTNCYT